VPLVSVIKDANAYASDVMRGKRVPGPQPEPSGNGASAAPPVRERSPAETRLVGLLQRQAELAAIDRPTPQDDQEYAAVISAISEAVPFDAAVAAD